MSRSSSYFVNIRNTIKSKHAELNLRNYVRYYKIKKFKIEIKQEVSGYCNYEPQKI